MAVEDDARVAVGAELDRLRERFGNFSVERTHVENDPEWYDHGLTLVRETGLLADSGALVQDPRNRILLIRHPDAPEAWGTPGGGYEAGDESLAATAVREVREETGVRCDLVDVLTARIQRIEHRDEPGSYPMLTVEFVGRGDGPASATDDEEILTAEWFAEPPAALYDRTQKLLTK